MNICINCGSKADHLHHIVPRSLGGVAVVPLCIDCHGKVHGIKMKHSRLTKLALIKKQAAQVSFVLWRICLGENYTQIKAESLNIGYPINANRLVRRMKEYDIYELLDICEPILQLQTNEVYTRDVVAQMWNEMIERK